MNNISPVLSSGSSRLQTVLSAAGLRPQPAASREERWGVTIGRRRGNAYLAADWLVFDFPPRRGRKASHLLARNAGLTGNAKHVLQGDSVRLRAEVPQDEPATLGVDELGVLVTRAGEGLSFALGIDSAGSMAAAAPDAVCTDEDASPQQNHPSLSELCAEAGWTFSERSQDRIQVDLQVSDDAFYQASLERRADGLRLSVDPNRGDPPTDAIARLAVATLLLSITGSIRMVSAVSRTPDADANPDPDAEPALLLQVDLPATPSWVVLAHGLSALSIACDLGSREVRALAEDSGLARSYLETCHPRSLPRPKRLGSTLKRGGTATAPAGRAR